MRVGTDKLLEIVGGLHDGVADEEGWRRAFGAVGECLNDPLLFLASGVSDGADFDIHVPRPHLPPEILSRVAGPLGNAIDNPWIAAAKTAPLRRVLRGEDLGPGVLHESRVWRELCAPLGISGMLGAVLDRQPHGADVICLGRMRSDFTGAEIRALTLLLPHIARAWRVRRQLAEWEALARALTAVLDRIDRGVVIADGDGHVRFANRAADRLLTEGDGLDVTRGRLRAERASETDALHQMIRRAARTGAGEDDSAVDAMALPGRDGASRIAVVAEPLAPSHNDRLGQHAQPGAILFLSDAQAESRPDPARLRLIYGLTAGEANVAAHMISGEGVAAAADALGITENTVKAHLKAVYDKVGVTRQAQLVRRMLADVGGLAPRQGLGDGDTAPRA